MGGPHIKTNERIQRRSGLDGGALRTLASMKMRVRSARLAGEDSDLASRSHVTRRQLRPSDEQRVGRDCVAHRPRLPRDDVA